MTNLSPVGEIAREGDLLQAAEVVDRPLTVLVTGATGFAGSHTTRALLDAGHRVRAFVRSLDKAHRVLGEHERLELARGDIGDPASVREALRGCDGVIHCAAVVAVGIKGSPEELLQANVTGVRNVVGTAIEENVERIVHVSSLATLFRGDGSVLSETSEPCDSKLPYGQSKVVAEHYVREKQAQGHPVKIVYPAAIIGPDDPGFTEPLNALRTFIQDFIPLTTAGMQFVDVRDVAVALTRIIEAEPGPGRYLVRSFRHAGAPGDLGVLEHLRRRFGEPHPLRRRRAGRRLPVRPRPGHPDGSARRVGQRRDQGHPLPWRRHSRDDGQSPLDRL